MLSQGREEEWSKRTKRRGFASLFDVADILGPLDRRIELPSGTQATVGEIMDATA